MRSNASLPRWQGHVAVLAPPLVALAFVGALAIGVSARRASARWVQHTQAVVRVVDELQIRIVDAESGLRGYLITGDTAYLAPYRGAATDTWRLVALLRRETRDNPVQQRNLTVLEPLLRERLTILDRRLAARRTGDLAAARSVIPGATGMRLMEGIRARLEAIRREEMRLLAARGRREARFARLLLWLLFAGSGVLVGTSILTNLLLHRNSRAQEALNLDLTRVNERLQEQATELEAQRDELRLQAGHLEETMVELESAVAERERRQADLLESNRLLSLRTAEAEAANRAKAEFLATMSHELRTPLNAIAGYVDLMDLEIYGPITAEQRSGLERVRASQRHLLSLINDVLYFAKLSVGRIEVRSDPLSVDELLHDVESVIGPLVQARELTYGVSPSEHGLRVLGDRGRVGQVLLNLLSNAVKYTGRGGRIEVGAEAAEGVVRIHVRDDGRGIPADKQEEIFDPFVQLKDPSPGTLSEGVGLGLSISRELARAMDGDLTVESAPGEGSVFTLTLPEA